MSYAGVLLNEIDRSLTESLAPPALSVELVTCRTANNVFAESPFVMQPDRQFACCGQRQRGTDHRLVIVLISELAECQLEGAAVRPAEAQPEDLKPVG